MRRPMQTDVAPELSRWVCGFDGAFLNEPQTNRVTEKGQWRVIPSPSFLLPGEKCRHFLIQ